VRRAKRFLRRFLPVGGSPETQFLSHGHEITQVTQLLPPLPFPRLTPKVLLL
jgi:hypothetical protein